MTKSFWYGFAAAIAFLILIGLTFFAGFRAGQEYELRLFMQLLNDSAPTLFHSGGTSV